MLRRISRALMLIANQSGEQGDSTAHAAVESSSTSGVMADGVPSSIMAPQVISGVMADTENAQPFVGATREEATVLIDISDIIASVANNEEAAANQSEEPEGTTVVIVEGQVEKDGSALETEEITIETQQHSDLATEESALETQQESHIATKETSLETEQVSMDTTMVKDEGSAEEEETEQVSMEMKEDGGTEEEEDQGDAHAQCPQCASTFSDWEMLCRHAVECSPQVRARFCET